MSFLYPFLQWGNLFPYPPRGGETKIVKQICSYTGVMTQMEVGRVREHSSSRSAQPEGLDPPPTYSNGTADLLGSNAPHESKCISAEGRYALADYSSLGET